MFVRERVLGIAARVNECRGEPTKGARTELGKGYSYLLRKRCRIACCHHCVAQQTAHAPSLYSLTRTAMPIYLTRLRTNKDRLPVSSSLQTPNRPALHALIYEKYCVGGVNSPYSVMLTFVSSVASLKHRFPDQRYKAGKQRRID